MEVARSSEVENSAPLRYCSGDRAHDVTVTRTGFSQSLAWPVELTLSARFDGRQPLNVRYNLVRNVSLAAEHVASTNVELDWFLAMASATGICPQSVLE